MTNHPLFGALSRLARSAPRARSLRAVVVALALTLFALWSAPARAHVHFQPHERPEMRASSSPVRAQGRRPEHGQGGGSAAKPRWEGAADALGALKVNAGVALDHQRPRLAGGGLADAAIPATLGGAPVTLDAIGNIRSLKATGYEWARKGTLRNVTPPTGPPESFSIDADERRTTHYAGAVGEFYDQQGAHRIATVTDPNLADNTLPQNRPLLTHRWMFDGIDHPVRLKYQPNSAAAVTTVFYELDTTGNVRRLHASGGADLGGYRFTAFGKTVEDTATATLNQPLRWKGRPTQTFGTTEVYDMRARQWCPELGSFLTIDEYRFHDARSTLWGWPHQNPIRWRDPSGHHPPGGWELKAQVEGGGYGPTEAATEAAVGALGLAAAPEALAAASALDTAAGIALWGELANLGWAGDLAIALLGGPTTGQLFPPNQGAPPGTFGPGSKAGMCPQCADRALAANPNATKITPEGGFPHVGAYDPTTGMVRDPSLRDNLGYYGKEASDIRHDQIDFGLSEWNRFVARFGPWANSGSAPLPSWPGPGQSQ